MIICYSDDFFEIGHPSSLFFCWTDRTVRPGETERSSKEEFRFGTARIKTGFIESSRPIDCDWWNDRNRVVFRVGESDSAGRSIDCVCLPACRDCDFLRHAGTGRIVIVKIRLPVTDGYRGRLSRTTRGVRDRLDILVLLDHDGDGRYHCRWCLRQILV